jgi:hypothetical protein
MNRRFAVGIGAAAVAALAALPMQQGTRLSVAESQRVAGGCTAAAKVACRQAALAAAPNEACSVCDFANRKCLNSHANQVCNVLSGTAAEDCISCGTCTEPCGGNREKWTAANCTGSVMETSECNQDWTDAQNGTCSQACGT